jgi:hypothetical protein
LDAAIVQVDRQRIKQGLGLAINVNMLSYALRLLRDLQMVEKLNAINIDMEEEETKMEIVQHNRMTEDRREMEAMMKLKKETKESCLSATTEHLLAFVMDNPDAKFHQWIKDLHPENTYNGTLLEGMGKTINYCFFVEESNLLDPDCLTKRNLVPVRARQMDKNGESGVAADLVLGSTVGRDKVPAIPPRGEIGKLDGKSLELDTIQLVAKCLN